MASLSQKERVFFYGRDAMFLKRLERRKSGKKHTYWALVESYRTEKGSRHRVVAYLGELKKSEANGWAALELPRDDPEQRCRHHPLILRHLTAPPTITHACRKDTRG